ncbi:MarR family winged helix-turn-helix transcriptional regulator [Xylanibacillus composti]|uniref:MarR family winged helix-turn-helix transcriptional regulator n=1 Tax=Xylanibacillus composti TaxID=1572762 RepID=UPI001BCE1306|nr:MarR family transcriptional regulator [Xylanibacillus composti]
MVLSKTAQIEEHKRARAELFYQGVHDIQLAYRQRLSRMLSEVDGGTVTIVQFLIMRRVEVEGPQTIGTLAAWNQVTPATMSPIIDKLERRGFAFRQQHLSDKRTYRVHLTEEGSQLVRKLNERWKQEMAPSFMALTGREQIRILELLDKVKQHIQAADEDGWN